MPRRGTPTTYPAPPLEFADRGLIGPSPCMPVPCRREIFSSSVISFSTMAARWSGDSDVFIQGREDALSRGPANADRTARFRIIKFRAIKLKIPRRIRGAGECRAIGFLFLPLVNLPKKWPFI